MRPVPAGDEREDARAGVRDAVAVAHLSYEGFDDPRPSVLAAGTRDEVALVVAALPAPADPRVVDITGMNGRIRRTGGWVVPRVLRIESEYGSVRLDFRQAVFESPVVDLELQLPYGGATLLVPADAVVDLEGLRTVWKQPRYTPPPRSAARGPVIRLTGTMEYGRLRIRHART